MNWPGSLCAYSFATSNTYGHPRAEGVTESVIGRWMAAGHGRRDRTVLATKLYGGKGERPNDRFLSALNIRRACEESLRRLGTDDAARPRCPPDPS